MTTYGVTADGFVLKRLDDIKGEMEQALKDIFGDIDVSASSVFGQLIGGFSKPYADIWEQMEKIYLSQSPQNAEGLNLDYILALNGLERLPAESTVVEIALAGTSGTVVSSGHRVKNPSATDEFLSVGDITLGNTSQLEVAVRIDSLVDSTTYDLIVASDIFQENSGVGGTVDTLAQQFVDAINHPTTGSAFATAEKHPNGFIKLTSKGSVFDTVVDTNMTFFNINEYNSEDRGPIPAVAFTITEIVTPVSGLAEIVNFEDGTEGRDEELDSEARARREQSLQVAGAGTLASMVARMLDDVDGVIAVKGFENRTDVTDGDGRPPHSVELVVDGGTDADVANQVWLTKPGGIQTYGNTNYDITDSNGDLQTMYFSRPVSMYTWVRATLTLYSEEQYPVDGDDQVAGLIKDYGDTFEIGLDILPDRIKASFILPDSGGVPGIQSAIVEVYADTNPGATPVYQTTPFVIADDEIAKFDLSRITIIS